LSNFAGRLYADGRVVRIADVDDGSWHVSPAGSTALRLESDVVVEPPSSEVLSTRVVLEVDSPHEPSGAWELSFDAELAGPGGAPALSPVTCASGAYGVAWWIANGHAGYFPRWDLVVPPAGAPTAAAAVPIIARPNYL